MKAMFGLQDLEYDDDAAHAIFHPMGYWQNTRSLTYGTVYEMCDAIRDDTAEESIHIPEGLGLTKALPNYARWYREKWLPGSKFPGAGAAICEIQTDMNAQQDVTNSDTTTGMAKGTCNASTATTHQWRHITISRWQTP